MHNLYNLSNNIMLKLTFGLNTYPQYGITFIYYNLILNKYACTVFNKRQNNASI